jgi:hypothetical protein
MHFFAHRNSASLTAPMPWLCTVQYLGTVPSVVPGAACQGQNDACSTGRAAIACRSYLPGLETFFFPDICRVHGNTDKMES